LLNLEIRTRVDIRCVLPGVELGAAWKFAKTRILYARVMGKMGWGSGGDAGLSRESGSKKAGSGTRTALSPVSYEMIFLQSAYSFNYFTFTIYS
jgi:hypothetical protein